MSDKYILDAEGNPQSTDDLLKWGRWLETSKDERRVAYTKLANGVKVSTVFLGLDHSFGGSKPLLYETMIFGGENDGWQDRYSTRSEAEVGHKFACEVAQQERT